MQDHVRLHQEVRKQWWHLVGHWNKLVCSQGNPKMSASNRLQG